MLKNLHDAMVAHQAGNLGQAESLYRRVLEHDRNQLQVLSMLGILHAQRGKYIDAQRVLKQALKLDPGHAGNQFNYGNVLLGLKRLDEAFTAFGKALLINPGLAEAHLNRGNILMLQKRYQEAATCFTNATRANPKFAQAFCNRAQALEEMGQFDQALASCDEAINVSPAIAEFHACRTNILGRLKRYDEALNSISKALSLRPDSAAFHYNHGNILTEIKNYHEAIAAFSKALALEPGFARAHLNEGLCRLLLGDTEHGWRKYEYRLKLPEYLDLKRDFGKPLWSGDSSLNRKAILVHAEQGFGDTLMMCRYVPLLAAHGARVIFEVKPGLTRLFESLAGVSTLIARGETVPQFDIHCPIMSLPIAFKTRLETVPASVPYLSVQKENVDQWRSKVEGGRFKVGVAWAGNPSFRNDRERSITLQNILPIFSAAGATFFSIQKDLREGDAEILGANPHIRHLGDQLDDFMDTAAAMNAMDLIISSDTSIVHLAGALGRPVWILLSDNPDWRWLLDRTDSPWYPTARLFRQTKSGDWSSVVSDVCAELERTAAQVPLQS